MPEITILSLDVGTSSVRTFLFDEHGRRIEGFGTQIPYQLVATADGGVEVDAEGLAGLLVESISGTHQQMSGAGRRVSAVAFCTFWHNVLGVGENGAPTTPIIHLFDTRSAGAAKELASRIDAGAQHSRTGCVLHPSYLPAKLLWLSQARAEAFRSSKHWMSFGEYFFFKLFGAPVTSISMVSGSGLWNQHENDYDGGILSVLPADRTQLAAVDQMDQPCVDLKPEYRALWPQFSGIPWFPAFGDGACNHIGSGCTRPDQFSLMVGTSGAMRALIEGPKIEIPEGLWCYRVDRKRPLLGGALSNGGEVFAWMKRTLVLPPDNQIEKEVAALYPGAHGLTMLPLFAGERSTKWRGDARAAITGMSLATTPIDIVRAALESVALRFRNIYDLMQEKLGDPAEVIGSGAALLHSPAWTQMMADALGRPIVMCLEKEASSRGAALLALERIGAIGDIRDLPAEMGARFNAVEGHRAIYEEQLRRQRRLYRKLFEEK